MLRAIGVGSWTGPGPKLGTIGVGTWTGPGPKLVTIGVGTWTGPGPKLGAIGVGTWTGPGPKLGATVAVGTWTGPGPPMVMGLGARPGAGAACAMGAVMMAAADRLRASLKLKRMNIYLLLDYRHLV